MCLARSVNFYDHISRQAQNFEMGKKLTDVTITQLKDAGIDGVYIDTIRSSVRMVSSINNEIKTEAITGIQNLADNFINSKDGVKESDVDQISDTAQKLIGSLSKNKDILINIADVKMYDDYTYYHSLSVAIMALAVGLELGLDNQHLNELGISGLLHDIGKTSVPIEIINKPAKLTPQEFAIVRMHPIYAAKHLRDRHLVNDNVYNAIIQHHEKSDGSGYPNLLTEEQIHPYAKILAVADVYDALTSNRPYRKPNPPNEAIEYIMACSGTHFDERVVRAFIRKVAPFPSGANVKLSTGETGHVLKNFSNSPLRPLVSVDGKDKCYNLAEDTECYSIVITGIIENENISGREVLIRN